MLFSFSFWIWGAIITQLLTACAHSLSFIAKPKPANETEKQLLDLMGNYKLNMGGGIHRNFKSLFIGVSICYTFIYIFGAVLNWYFLKPQTESQIWEGLLLIQVIIFGIVLFFQVRFTFWPPIIVSGLVFLFLLGSYLSVIL